MSRTLVLIGGGHSHAIALKLWAMNPLRDVRLILISDRRYTPYSGMLPGHVAGFYTFQEIHIDLESLANLAQAQFYLDSAIGLDLINQQVICEKIAPVKFDYLSIDIGSTPAINQVPGAKDYAIPAKPVFEFLQAWNQILETVKNSPQSPLIISIVGGGAGGVELALNMQAHLRQILKQAQQPIENVSIHLFHRDRHLLSGHNRWVSRRLEQILCQRNIQLHLSENIIEVLSDRAICQSGLMVECDRVFWVTQASAPAWIHSSGITTDSQGFIWVDDTLQSISHPGIFATGDIATMQNHPRPKAGVFAVRQGKPLWENWQRILSDKPLKAYIPQKRYLSLIGTGDKSAIASWGYWEWESPLLWSWKDSIDRKFMKQFYV